MKYRYLNARDLVRYGDQRWDYELGWVTVRDSNMKRFGKEYRRVGAMQARLQRWRRKIQ